MSTDEVLDFTVADLLEGGDDLLRLVTADEPGGLWAEVVRWPRHRLTAALVAAVGVIQNEEPEETTGGHAQHSSAAGHRPADQDTARTPSDGD